jgi:hypothetical protein
MFAISLNEQHSTSIGKGLRLQGWIWGIGDDLFEIEG